MTPVATFYQYLCHNWLSNLVFYSYEAVINAACEAWNKLIKQPDTTS